MLPYLIAGAIGFGIAKLFEEGGETFGRGGQINSNFAKKEWNSYLKDSKIDALISSGYSKKVARDLSSEAWESLEKNVQNAFKNYLISEEVRFMKSMMQSLYIYGGIEKGSDGYDRYLSKYENSLGKKMFDKIYEEELERLQGYEVEKNVYTDSEGLSYSSLKRKYTGGGEAGKSMRDNYDALIGRVGIEYYFLDEIFKYKDGFKGATGTIVMPVSKQYYDYATSEEGILERYMDAMGEYEWLEVLGLNRDDFEDEDEMIKAIEDGIYDLYRVGELNPFEEVSYELEEQMRELPEFSDSDEYPLFEIIGGGRIFEKNTKFDKIYNQELFNKIKEIEEFAEGGEAGKKGKLNATYIPKRNIKTLTTTYGNTIKGKDLLDGAYTTRKDIRQDPKMVRTMFEEEEFAEFKNGGGVYDNLPILAVRNYDADYFVNESGEIVDNGSIKRYAIEIQSVPSGDVIDYTSASSEKEASEMIEKINNTQKLYANGGLAKKRRRRANTQTGRTDRSVDKTRVGKPVGYRFSNSLASKLRKDQYAVPTEKQITKYLGKGIYKENRKNRSDRDRTAKL